MTREELKKGYEDYTKAFVIKNQRVVDLTYSEYLESRIELAVIEGKITELTFEQLQHADGGRGWNRIYTKINLLETQRKDLLTKLNLEE